MSKKFERVREIVRRKYKTGEVFSSEMVFDELRRDGLKYVPTARKITLFLKKISWIEDMGTRHFFVGGGIRREIHYFRVKRDNNG